MGLHESVLWVPSYIIEQLWNVPSELILLRNGHRRGMGMGLCEFTGNAGIGALVSLQGMWKWSLGDFIRNGGNRALCIYKIHGNRTVSNLKGSCGSDKVTGNMGTETGEPDARPSGFLNN